jgi:hypothetical protein
VDGQLLQPLALGALSVIMPPFEFLKRSVRWLELIDRHRLDVSLAPNFAYVPRPGSGHRSASPPSRHRPWA